MVQGLKKYDDILRIKTSNILPYRRSMDDKQIKILFDGEVIVEEKVDGGIVGLSYVGDEIKIQGRGRYILPSENSKQFYGLNSWAYQHYENIMLIPEGWIVFGEWLRVKHNIFYDRLPDYFIAFDVWDGTKYLLYKDKCILLSLLNFNEVPFICNSKSLSIKDIPKLIGKSRYSSSEIMEGLVFKNQTNGLYGKYVRREFDDSIEEHWLKQPIIENRLAGF